MVFRYKNVPTRKYEASPNFQFLCATADAYRYSKSSLEYPPMEKVFDVALEHEPPESDQFCIGGRVGIGTVSPIVHDVATLGARFLELTARTHPVLKHGDVLVVDRATVTTAALVALDHV